MARAHPSCAVIRVSFDAEEGSEEVKSDARKGLVLMLAGVGMLDAVLNRDTIHARMAYKDLERCDRSEIDDRNDVG